MRQSCHHRAVADVCPAAPHHYVWFRHTGDTRERRPNNRMQRTAPETRSAAADPGVRRTPRRRWGGRSGVNMRGLIKLSLCIAPWVAVYAAAQDESLVKKTTYLVIYRPGPGWIAGKPLADQPLGEHGKYMLSLYVKGVLKFAGPFSDNSGGAVAFEAANEGEAKAVVAQDPAVIGKVFVGELHPWRLTDWEQFAKKQRAR